MWLANKLERLFCLVFDTMGDVIDAFSGAHRHKIATLEMRINMLDRDCRELEKRLQEKDKEQCLAGVTPTYCAITVDKLRSLTSGFVGELQEALGDLDQSLECCDKGIASGSSFSEGVVFETLPCGCKVQTQDAQAKSNHRQAIRGVPKASR